MLPDFTGPAPYYAAPLRVIGVLSGTSVDAIDTAICELEPESEDTPGVLRLRICAYAVAAHAIPHCSKL